MDVGLLVQLAGAVLGLAAVVYTARSSRAAAADRLEREEKEAREREERETREARRAAEDGAYRRAEAFDVGLQARMQAEINRQAEQIHALNRRVNRLTRQLISAGLAPEEENEHA